MKDWGLIYTDGEEAVLKESPDRKCLIHVHFKQKTFSAIIDFSQFLLMSVAPPQKVFKNLLQFKELMELGKWLTW